MLHNLNKYTNFLAIPIRPVLLASPRGTLAPLARASGLAPPAVPMPQGPLSCYIPSGILFSVLIVSAPLSEARQRVQSLPLRPPSSRRSLAQRLARIPLLAAPSLSLISLSVLFQTFPSAAQAPIRGPTTPRLPPPPPPCRSAARRCQSYALAVPRSPPRTSLH